MLLFFTNFWIISVDNNFLHCLFLQFNALYDSRMCLTNSFWTLHCKVCLNSDFLFFSENIEYQRVLYYQNHKNRGKMFVHLKSWIQNLFSTSILQKSKQVIKLKDFFSKKYRKIAEKLDFEFCRPYQSPNIMKKLSRFC